MAKKKSANRGGRPPSGKPMPRIVVQVRGTEKWAEYVERFAAERGVDRSTLVEEAIQFYAVHLRRELPPNRK